MKRLYGWGIIRTMIIAYKNLFRKKVTVQYPFEKLTLPERARWAVEPLFDEEGNTKCTGCLICEKACPDYIIEIKTTTDEDKNKHIDSWNYEIGACMMCGLCVEACPFDAIRMGHDYELARVNPDTLTIKLLEDVPASKGKKKPKAADVAGDAKKTDAPASSKTTPQEAVDAPQASEVKASKTDKNTSEAANESKDTLSASSEDQGEKGGLDG